ncbi:MAG: phenylalanine--tRNA ligase subunit beta [Candidatus Omnitrophica bacterium]|nr:phenylalanine--tRNA ligase subunit beta [Candidatus Omnitrophota bacterium]
MKVTYSWLKDFIDIKISPRELADKLTIAGLEVVSLEELEKSVSPSGRDFVFEIEITSNRPDWLSILGVAREISAITGSKLKSAKTPKVKFKGLKPIEILVAESTDCPFYSAMIIRGVKVAPSPEWLKKRLEALGCRSVNNIVDITNYVLFESGQPLHAFDLDKLSQQAIYVRRGRPNESITIIDGQQKILDNEILVIADKNRAVAIAGVMGGKNTEVTEATCNILLESAVFNPIVVRRGRQKLGLQSESAYRFERGVDLENAQNATFSALKLISALAFGKPDAYKHLGSIRPIKSVINLEMDYLSRVLGVSLSVLKVKQILSGLGFTVKVRGKNVLTVKIPSFRQDVKTQIDLVEEVARIYGYEKIPLSLPAVKPHKIIPTSREVVSDIKIILQGLGLQEAITYSLVDRLLLAKSGIKKDIPPVEILNPLSKEQEVLRFSLLPSLIRTLAYNLNQQQEYVNIFEVANVFSAKPGSAQHSTMTNESVRPSVQEELSLGIALCGARPFFIKQGLVRDEVTILHLKGILESLLNKLGVKNYDFSPRGGNQASIIIDQQEIGFIVSPSEQILNSFDIKNKQVVLGEINLVKLLSQINLTKKFTAIPKYPAITRDISFVVREDVSIRELLMAIEAKGAPLLFSAKVVDYYQGKQIPSGFRGLTVSCTYRAPERTLTEEEIAPLHNAICALLEERFGIKLR